MWLASFLIAGPLASALLAAACIEVRGEQITPQDLAPAIPAFASLAPDLRLGWAPVPGVTRWLSAGDLTRFARQHGVDVTPASVPASGLCLTRRVAALPRTDLLSALAAALPHARIELLGYGPTEVPPGQLEFTAKTLPPLPRQPGVPIVVWRGRLRTEFGRSVPVWVRARIAVTRVVVAARRDLEAGQLLAADDLEQKEVAEYAGWTAPLADSAALLGRRLRRALPAHMPVLPHLLSPQRDIERGDEVAVTLPGEATLTARAESPGRVGDTVLLKNPLNGRRFPSKVTAPGRAVLLPTLDHPPEDPAVAH